MERTKKSMYKLLFYLKKNELKKNGNALPLRSNQIHRLSC